VYLSIWILRFDIQSRLVSYPLIKLLRIGTFCFMELLPLQDAKGGEKEQGQLQRWAKRGIRVSSGLPLVHAAGFVNVDVMRFLVNDLGADVNQAINDCTPLYAAAQECHLDSVRCLANELGADINQGDRIGSTPLINAARNGRLAVVQCLVKKLGADANRAEPEGGTPLYIAAQMGHLAVVQCLIQEGGADVNQATKDGAIRKHKKVIAYLLKRGADPQLSVPKHGTAADISKASGASATQTAYLAAKTHCSNPGCGGAGVKKCTGCKQARYCGQQCQLAHWSMHKAGCKARGRKFMMIFSDF
jgi:hypothetical protein